MKLIWKYLITFAVGAVVCILVLVGKGTFVQTNTQIVMRDLCDAFFVPGVMFTGVGLLVFVSNGGMFDMLVFGVMKLFDLFKRDLTKVKYRTFYDYKQSLEGKERSFWYIIIVGVVFIAIAAIFLALFYKFE